MRAVPMRANLGCPCCDVENDSACNGCSRGDSVMLVERWREYPEYPHYDASNLGRIRNGQTKKILKAVLREGYLCVQLHVRNADYSPRRVWRFVHTMVCTTWHGERPTPQHEACHKNGKRPDCDVSNLYWGTRQDQIEDKRKHGTAPKSVPPKSHASDCTAEILCLLDGGFSKRRIAEVLGCHRSTVTKVVQRSIKEKHRRPRQYDFAREAP